MQNRLLANRESKRFTAVEWLFVAAAILVGSYKLGQRSPSSASVNSHFAIDASELAAKGCGLLVRAYRFFATLHLLDAYWFTASD